MRRALLMAGIIVVTLATVASGMVMDSAGNVTDWGLRPFSHANQSNFQNGTLWSTIENNYSPINYPSGIGHVPSPGGSTGELFDLEEMHVRIAGGQLEVLVVTSSPLAAQAAGGTWYLGDLFLTLGDQRFGIVTQQASQGLARGSVYRLNGSADTAPLQTGSASYLGRTAKVANDYGPDDTVQNIAGPWAVKSGIDVGKLLGTATLSSATFSYGGAENNTYLMEYSVDAGLLGILPPGGPMAQMTWGCGNDTIRVQSPVALVPEPATIGLLLFGAMMTWLSRRRAKLG